MRRLSAVQSRADGLIKTAAIRCASTSPIPRLSSACASIICRTSSSRAGAHIVFVSVNVILAFYPSKVPFQVEDQVLRFTIPRVGEYELAAVTVG